ncbi:hypothetical protein Pcinc_001448 [Petrolisthes cinctipes]|uniref:Uncharacterized protein n=1 Tax=Petrolisthes cinctipes TaxID=88211 RepID=A0AAE1L5Z2_PETCI|nr:hypothetical protein Pcinc_001448 [Petrolisthes cinctipes]
MVVCGARWTHLTPGVAIPSPVFTFSHLLKPFISPNTVSPRLMKSFPTPHHLPTPHEVFPNPTPSPHAS